MTQKHVPMPNYTDIEPTYSDDQIRVLAIELAVKYQASVNSNPSATPANIKRVLEQADAIYNWLN